MPPKKPGRIVDVRSRFHSEAIKPGGVSRESAKATAGQAVAEVQRDLCSEIAGALDPLLMLLSDWAPDTPSDRVSAACRWASTVRDMAGLAGSRLLTEVAMHTFDCLDAVLIDGVVLTTAEAAIYADALVFARADACRGKDLAPYSPLLRNLSALTDHVLDRASAA